MESEEETSEQERLQKMAEMLHKIQDLLGRIEEYVDVTLDASQSSHPLRSYALRELGNESSGKLLYSKFLSYRSTNPGSVSMTAFGTWICNGMRDIPIRTSLIRREGQSNSHRRKSNIKRVVFKKRRRSRKIKSSLL